MVTTQTVRRWILTGSITAITVTGAIYGAQLKTRQELRQEKKKILEAGPEEQIAQLEGARSELITKKNELERKIATVSARRIAREQQDKDAK
ncbi:hypothetical protein GQ43DRAFT_365913 [Delitschia confertaspora ATCC 74209]|uniref:Uncharacterized protein n=1 Tax=Delitschia confertaspora ATCC 74209 TaxID=1513339 RepID=A0A9P4MS89_9PLEO|nr:hypothetical protein GQ43DRAFT_365913 [Delitschia confertaspora ATCC 74209]